MAKGIFTQSAVILFERKLDIGELAQALAAEFTIARQNPQTGPWQFGGPSLLVAYRPELNGYALLDLVHERWPDHMGDPKNDTTLFGAWTMGFFGLHTYPGGLARAVQQSWSWSEAGAAVERHHAFLRLKISYSLGADKDKPVIPHGVDSRDELAFLNRLATAALRVPGALCYFNPNGEVLRDAGTLADSLDFAAQRDLPPLDAWCNVRMFNIGDGWLLMDTVGNWQLDIADLEAAFPKNAFEPGAIDGFLRNLSSYVLDKPDALQQGHTVDGPNGSTWRIGIHENGLIDPPRQVLRCIPIDAQGVPEALKDQPQAQPDSKAPEQAAQGAKPWWKRW